MAKSAFLLAVAAAGLGLVAAECPNACSGHGQCGSFDMCTCDRNWQGSDCSLRTCPFGLAHVDTPKGDLDGSISVEDHDDLLISGSTVYPYGTTEGYPHMVDTAGNVQTDTAHDYMECSNKGLCDRKTGMCECLPGYDGAACQRASCPSKAESPNKNKSSSTSNLAPSGGFSGRSAFMGRAQTVAQKDQCSGHGTCETIAELAFHDNENVYDLWDKDVSMGCKCDPGYGGPDCSTRHCKYGIDPLFTDETTARVTHTSVRIESSASNTLGGQYAIKFYDVHGEDYITEPLDISPTGVINTVPHCDDVKAALLALPNGVVPSIECSQNAINTDYGFEYTLTFTGNPGKLQQLEIDQYLDGARPTITVSSGTYTADVYTPVIGEFVDYFPAKCNGLTVKILADSDDTTDAWNGDVRPGSLGYISGPSVALTTAEAKLLKACLGGSDYDDDNNEDVANWDKGFVVEADGAGPTTYNMIGAFPHAIKVVPVETSSGYNQFTHGEHYLVWFDPNASAGKQFRVANLASGANTVGEATESYVYTTTGTVQQMAWGAENPLQIKDNSGGGVSSQRIVGRWDKYSNKIYTNYDTSCENNPSAGSRNHKCVEKGDLLFLVDGCWGAGDLGAGTTNPFFGGPTVYNCADSTEPNYNTGNIYTVTKVYKALLGANSTTTPSTTVDAVADPNAKHSVDTNIIEVDVNIGWRGLEGDPENSNTNPVGTRDEMWSDNTGIVTLFHFTPPSALTDGDTCTPDKQYEYVSQCSNRGICEASSGLCQCFKGYTSDDCSIQNALATA